MDTKEKLEGNQNVVTVDSVNNMVTVHKPNGLPNELPKAYSFDSVFDTDTSQVLVQFAIDYYVNK